MYDALVIKNNAELRFENLATFRDVIKSTDVEKSLINFANNIKNNGAIQNGPLISTTYKAETIENVLFLDIEFLISIDKEIPLEPPYKFKPQFYLKHAITARHTGDPNQLETTYNKLFKYISKEKLQQITSVYNVNIKDHVHTSNTNNVIDLYIGINPSIL